LTDGSEASFTEGDAGGDSEAADEMIVADAVGSETVGSSAVVLEAAASGLFCRDSILRPFFSERNGERSPPTTRAPGFLPPLFSVWGLSAGAGVAGSTSMSLCEESEKSHGFLVAPGGDLTADFKGDFKGDFKEDFKGDLAAMLSSRDMSMEESESAKNLDTFSTRSMARSAAEYAPLTAVAGDFSNRSNAIPFAALDTGPSWRRSCHARMNRLERALSSITRTASEDAGPASSAWRRRARARDPPIPRALRRRPPRISSTPG
jgi:hypothetical protein